MTVSLLLHSRQLARWVAIAALTIVSITARGQTLPEAPTRPAATPRATGSYWNYIYQVGWVCGAGTSYSSPATKPTVQCGGILIWPLLEFEAGVMGPQASQSDVSGYLTANAWVPLSSMKSGRGVALFTGGYTRLFETGHALDYGFEYAHPIDGTHSIRFEARDYWTFSNPTQHNVLFRVAWLTGLPD